MKARSFIILAILLAYVLGTEAQSALTTDAMIRVAEQKSKLERMSADGKRMSPAQQPVLTFVVKVADEGAADTYARLREQGVTIRGRIGQQAIVQVPLDKVETISQMDGILRVDVGHKGQLTTNVSRGGYGSIHILNRIPQETYLAHPKWLIGHGDVTTLLHTIVSSDVMCVHGPMAFQMAGRQELATNITRDILFGTIPQYEVCSNDYNHCGHAEGILVGGNLSSYSSVVGTQFHIPPQQDVILFIEEVEESLHNIDRLFCHLRLQMGFEHVKGVILGSFSSIRFDLQFGSVEHMLTAHLAEYDIPVCCGFPVGSNSCIPLIEGAPCSLDVTTEKSVLTFNIDGERQSYNLVSDSRQLFR